MRTVFTIEQGPRATKKLEGRLPLVESQIKNRFAVVSRNDHTGTSQNALRSL